ncbi:hypothetical protein PV08_03886 [Exophiala spinifera]|uniref:Uncharacterized protein n=1 Tax=Exophiala spinifera TaxID=91928 RepID=A0A0D2BCJ4_9EURO|nr:uncharacterized protein PV08_03886 [Exophiala spinifera]KIW16698.1 hypothetical protein PV08_03886 [Exophiala spinifera]
MYEPHGRQATPVPTYNTNNNLQPGFVEEKTGYPDTFAMMPVGYCQHSAMLPPNHHCTCKEYRQNYYLQSHSRRPPGTLNPAISVPLSICTAGLSCAAMGIYRGIKEHQARRRHMKAQKETTTDVKTVPATSVVETSIVRPSSVSHIPEMPGDGVAGGHGHALEVPADDTTTAHHPMSPDSLLSPTYSELSASTGPMDKVETVSEIDSTPIEPPPEYHEKSSQYK